MDFPKAAKFLLDWSPFCGLSYHTFLEQKNFAMVLDLAVPEAVLPHLATLEQYRDFELALYVRGPKEHNGGVLVRSEGKGLAGKRHYEIQIHNVADAHFATGSLYYFKRAAYPRIEDGQWYPMQIRMQGRNCQPEPPRRLSVRVRFPAPAYRSRRNAWRLFGK